MSPELSPGPINDNFEYEPEPRNEPEPEPGVEPGMEPGIKH